jgi:altronate hydrolase
MSGKKLEHGDGRVSLTVHSDDNVATVLDTKTDLDRLAGGAPCVSGIPFGHKVALRHIKAGDAVIKYGVVIGHAQNDIAAGEHVHVHNLA